MTTVVLVDDADAGREQMGRDLEQRGIEVLGTAGDGRSGVELVRKVEPDVVVLDIRMRSLDGIAAVAQTLEARLPTRLLVLTAFELDEHVYDALRAGAAGFLPDGTAPDRIAEAIETVAAGEAMLSPVLTRRLVEKHVRRPSLAAPASPRLAALSDREVEVVRMVAEGLTNDEIGRRLSVATPTVRAHVNRILAKLDLVSRVQILVLAFETGIIRDA